MKIKKERELIEYHALSIFLIIDAYRFLVVLLDFLKICILNIVTMLATILTSGQAASAPQGAALLQQLVESAGQEVEILVGAGVSAANIPALAAQTGARAFHLSGKQVLDSRMTFRREGVPMGLPGFSEFEIWQTSEANIRAARTALDAL